jgi:hypothetical protein
MAECMMCCKNVSEAELLLLLYIILLGQQPQDKLHREHRNEEKIQK